MENTEASILVQKSASILFRKTRRCCAPNNATKTAGILSGAHTGGVQYRPEDEDLNPDDEATNCVGNLHYGIDSEYLGQLFKYAGIVVFSEVSLLSSFSRHQYVKKCLIFFDSSVIYEQLKIALQVCNCSSNSPVLFGDVQW